MRNLLNIWKNKGKILEGVQNSLFKKEHVEQIASERMQICVSCPQLDTEGLDCAVRGTQPCCGNCGCSLGFKTRSLSSSCPIGKWDALVSEAEEDIINAKLDIVQ